MAAEMPNLRYVPVLSEPAAEDAGPAAPLRARGRDADWPDPLGHQVYACGAPVMVDAAHRDFVRALRAADEEFYADSFTSEADKHGEA